MVNRLQTSIGVLGLLIGGAVYIIDRPPDRTYLFNLLPIWLSGYSTGPRLSTVVGGSLPPFIHALSFSMITSSLYPPKTLIYASICLTWLFIGVIFELGQGPGKWIVQLIPEYIDSIPCIGSVRDYFLLGTFDVLDLLAVILGSSIGFLLLLFTRNRRHKEL
jgi:hypothetical protein